MFYKAPSYQQNQLLIIDGTALLFRSYYGKDSFITDQGHDIGGFTGFLNRSRELIRDLKPQYLSFVFDAGRKTFRNDIYEQYKANRGEPPEDLVPQFDLCLNFCNYLGWPAFSVLNYEADDLVATLARLASENNIDTVIASSDKDIYQVISDTPPVVRVFDPNKQILLTEDSIIEKLGIPVDRVVHYMALTGDSTDNIPGAIGIGPKAAAALMQAFASIAEIKTVLQTDRDRFADLNVRGARTLADKLSDNISLVETSLKLVTLKDDIDLKINNENIRQKLSWRDIPPAAEVEFKKSGLERRLPAFQKLLHERQAFFKD